MRKRIERSKTLLVSKSEKVNPIWIPEIERIERVVIKNGRGHFVHEFGDPNPVSGPPETVFIKPLMNLDEKELQDFEIFNSGQIAGWAEVGSRMMFRVTEGHDLDGQWVTVYSSGWNIPIRR